MPSMAALSYYPDWEAPFDPYNPDYSTFFTPPQPDQLPSQLLACCMNNDFDFTFDDDNNFDPNEVFHFDEYCNSLPSSFDHQNQLLTPTLPAQQPFPFQQESDPYHHSKPKGQRPEEFGYEEAMFADSLFSDPVPAPCLNSEQSSPTETVPPLSDFAAAPPAFNIGSCEPIVKKKQTIVTPQSITARQRRRKIADRTQELSKMIPGAHRMNTAQMFAASYKYIKFLEAQVGILQLMASYDKEKAETFRSEELQGLVESTSVQERLYSNEKCLAPVKFVQALSNDGKRYVRYPPYIGKELRHFLPET